MDSSNIEIILRKLLNKNMYNKIFINGDWGIGKSYYAEKFSKEFPNNVLYISLFGKESYNSVQTAISYELDKKLKILDKLWHKLKRKIKNIQGGVSMPIYKTNFSLEFNINNKKNVIDEYFKYLNNSNIILIIDDLERKSPKISIEDIMGMIEQLSLCDKLKIVIIGSENNLTGQDEEKWLEFKEKIIDKEYKVTKYSNDAIDNLIINKLQDYISEDKLNNFIKTFFSKHKTNNLRTINKGVNLFIEVNKELLKKKNLDKSNIAILKNCMAISLENNDGLYAKSKLPLDERILKYYFSDVLVSNRESALFPYILKFNNQRVDYSFKSNFNNLLDKYIETDDSLNLFFMSQTKIKNELNKIYKQIINMKYKYNSLEKLLDDVDDLVVWNKTLDLKLNIRKLEKPLIDILIDEYYGKENFEENIITEFEINRRKTEEIKKFIKKYNDEIIDIYIYDNLEEIEYLFNVKKYKVSAFNWILSDFGKIYKDRIMKNFISISREYNYFIPNLSGNISKEKWEWISCVYSIFNNQNKYTKEFNNYIKTLKRSDKLTKYRLDILEKNEEK